MAQLSLTEVSKRFNINRTTVYRAVSTGKLSRLNNGLFDLAEVIRVFGEAPTAETAHAPVPDKESKLVEVLERELLFLKNQIEQKDKQINNLTLLLESSKQRPEASQSNDNETPIVSDIQNNETPYEANSNDTKQHHATVQNETSLIGILSRSVKKMKSLIK